MRSLCSHCPRGCNCSMSYSGSCPIYDDGYSPSATYKEPKEETTFYFPEIKPEVILSPKQYGMSMMNKHKKRR